MCGIAAIFSYGDGAPPAERSELLRIRESMRTRGPDGAGEWLSSDGRVAFGHRRLAIIDLSDLGAQPMHDRESGNVIVFNGEIYNYRDLRDELSRAGVTFASHSDTEVLLKLYARDGVGMLSRLRGMFAFALWDAAARELVLARDPYGIKPLYYADDGRTCRVASQVKALIASGAVSTRFDPAAAAGFYLRGTVPEPFTMYEAIRLLPAGSYLRIRDRVNAPVRYFSLSAVYAEAALRAGEAAGRELEIVRDAMASSVRAHLVADVPVGAFLSAGIDSAAVVGLAAEATKDIQTMTLQFAEYAGRDNDEVPEARGIASFYGVPHSPAIVTYETFHRELPHILAAMDQPSIDGVNAYLVSQAAASLGLKVAMSGAGGDELFGGYSSFRQIPRWVKMSRVASRIPLLPDLFLAINSAAARRSSHVNPKVGEILRYAHSWAGAYFVKRGMFLPSELPSLLGEELAREGLRRLDPVALIGESIDPDPGHPFARIAAMESAGYLRNQLLRDLDWASMAHSLEVRVPLVDATLVREIAPALLSSSSSKKEWLALAPRPPLPDAIRTRKKTGFTIPMKEWMRREAGGRVEFGKRSWARRLYADFFSSDRGSW